MERSKTAHERSIEYDKEQFDEHVARFEVWLGQDKVDFHDLFTLRMLIPHEKWAFEILQRIYFHPKFNSNTVEFCQKFLNLVFDYYFEIEGYMMDDFIFQMIKMGIRINASLDNKLNDNFHNLNQFYEHLLSGSYKHCKLELFDYLYERGIHLLPFTPTTFASNVIENKLYWCDGKIKLRDLYFIIKLFNSQVNRELKPRLKKMILPFITPYRHQTLQEVCQENCFNHMLRPLSMMEENKRYCVHCARIYFRNIDLESVTVGSNLGPIEVWINKLSFCSPECEKGFMGHA